MGSVHRPGAAEAAASLNPIKSMGQRKDDEVSPRPV